MTHTALQRCVHIFQIYCKNICIDHETLLFKSRHLHQLPQQEAKKLDNNQCA